MGLEVTVFCEGLIANLTLKGLFSRVGPLMDFEAA